MGTGLLSTPPRDDNPVMVSNTSAARRLKNFTKRVWPKVDCPLIRQPSKRPSAAKPVLPLWSKHLAAQSLSRVPASKRSEILIMQHTGLDTGLSSRWAWPRVYQRQVHR